MFQLRCTVRNCEEVLGLEGRSLRCRNGHHFDQARQGYWNLLQPQDSRSRIPGDSENAVDARHRWLQHGHMDGLNEAIRPWLEAHLKTKSLASGCHPGILDLGCGDGSFGAKLFPEYALGYCGIDLSKRAIKLAARNWRQATWVLANADRGLPVEDSSIDVIVSLFGRRPVGDMKRVLKDSGICIVAVPGEDDLIELREKVQQTGVKRSRWEAIVNEFNQSGLTFIAHERWRHQVQLTKVEIINALTMSYRAMRHSQKTRLENLDRECVTLSADLLLFGKSQHFSTGNQS